MPYLESETHFLVVLNTVKRYFKTSNFILHNLKAAHSLKKIFLGVSEYHLFTICLEKILSKNVLNLA